MDSEKIKMLTGIKEELLTDEILDWTEMLFDNEICSEENKVLVALNEEQDKVLMMVGNYANIFYMLDFDNRKNCVILRPSQEDGILETFNAINSMTVEDIDKFVMATLDMDNEDAEEHFLRAIDFFNLIELPKNEEENQIIQAQVENYIMKGCAFVNVEDLEKENWVERIQKELTELGFMPIDKQLIPKQYANEDGLVVYILRPFRPVISHKDHKTAIDLEFSLTSDVAFNCFKEILNSVELKASDTQEIMDKHEIQIDSIRRKYVGLPLFAYSASLEDEE